MTALIRDEFVPLVEDVPGFIWYVAGANPQTRGQFSVGVFEDESGAAESNRRAAEWGKLGAADFVEGDPAVYEGVIGVAAESSGAAVNGSPEALPPSRRVGREIRPDPVAATEPGLAGSGSHGADWGRICAAGAGDPRVRGVFRECGSGVGRSAYVGVFDDKAGADEIDPGRTRVVDGELVHVFRRGSDRG